MKDICYDEELGIEAYRFVGVAQEFPNHSHDYYVIGLIEEGVRRLTVNNRDYTIGPGDLMTFNPMDNHACTQLESGGLSYRCINISIKLMQTTVREVLSNDELRRFREPVQYKTEDAAAFHELHTCIMKGNSGFKKEELFLLFMERLLLSYTAGTTTDTMQIQRQELEAVCTFLENNYTKRTTLDELAKIAQMNKYTLIRTFTRLMGITPYRYLENIRISNAKKLLKNGVDLSTVALQTGFSDQSHFSIFFGRFIGLSPGQYQAIFNAKKKKGGPSV